MDGKDILTVIDVIRNEKVYLERLDELEKKIAAFRETQYIAATSEQAQAKLKLAEEALAEANSQAEKVVQEAEEKANTRLKELEEQENVLAKKKDEVNEQVAITHKLHDEVKAIQNSIDMKLKGLHESEEKFKLEKAEFRKMKEEFLDRMLQAKSLLGL